VATALLYRERSGKGQHLDLSLLDSYFHYLDGSVEVLTASRGAVKVRRSGNTVAALSPASISGPATAPYGSSLSRTITGRIYAV
jgi:crotonobetainyl-CoA:carnitine CoA-transferase CaiB-like acyl-CoA transferase